MGDINFTNGWADRLRFKHDASGIDVDFWDRTSKTYVTGRHLSRAEVTELVQFLAPDRAAHHQNRGVQVNDIINGFPNDGFVHEWAKGLRVVEVDFPLGVEDAKGVRAVNDHGIHYAFKYDEIEIVQRVEVPATTKERVAVSVQEDLYVGDVIVENDPAKIGVVVERKVPAKPAEPKFGYGTAYVFGMAHRDVPQERYQGFLSKSGWFYFLSPQGDQRTARPSQFEGFRRIEA